MLHLGVMNEALTPKQLAAIKMQARKNRIRNIRQRVAISVATVSAPLQRHHLRRRPEPAEPTDQSPAPLSIASTRTFGTSPNTVSTQVPVTSAPAPTTTNTVAPTPTPPPVTTSQS